MSSMSEPHVAIVDYGMGNMFSVRRACEQVGLPAVITSSGGDLVSAAGVIVPGVGAFGRAMDALRARGFVEGLREAASSGKPVLGICLGMQLLMSESHEFGRHQGLGILEGQVVRLQESSGGGLTLKVPQVGWNRLFRPAPGSWEGSCLKGLADGEFMYFVHSFYVKPVETRLVLSTTRYGPIEFCSTLQDRNVMGCQFHPERSGPAGLRIYQNLAMAVRRSTAEVAHG